MTDLKYDPELPIWVSYSSGDRPIARFRHMVDANRYRDLLMSEGVVIDTTPKPKIPEDAEFIFVENNDQSVFARREGIINGEMHWLIPGGYIMEAELVEDFIGDSEVTVLVRKEES